MESSIRLSGENKAMTFSKHVVPPLSPVLVAGLALRAMPLAVLNPLLDKALQMMLVNHSDVFERLSCLDDATFAINPTDLPFAFLLRPAHAEPSLTAVPSFDREDVSACIHGSFSVLTSLLEGKVDGDALVFSRELVIEGDTEAVLVLRNAVDGGDIDIKQDLASVFGPLSGLAARAADNVTSLFDRASADMELLKGAVIDELHQRVEGHSAQLDEMEENVTTLQKQMRKLRKRI